MLFDRSQKRTALGSMTIPNHCILYSLNSSKPYYIEVGAGPIDINPRFRLTVTGAGAESVDPGW